MIFDFVLKIVSWILLQLVNILPSLTVFPAGLAADIADFMLLVYGWNWIAPIGTILTVFSLIVLLVFIEFTYFTAMYIFSIIHASIRG